MWALRLRTAGGEAPDAAEGGGVTVPVPRLALTKAEAAASLGMSIDSLERYVLPELRVVRKGRLVLISARELERWLDRNGDRLLGEAA